MLSLIYILLLAFLLALVVFVFHFVERLRKFFFLLPLLAVLCAAYSVIEPYWLKTTSLTFFNADVPPSFDGTTIAFVSDIHHGPLFSRRRVKRLVERLNQLKPDMVIFGGDYVHTDRKYIQPCFDELQFVQATSGRFGVLGNHDHWEDAELSRQAMRKAAITNLDNQAVWIVQGRERIKIGGVGDLWEDTQDLRPTLHDVTEQDFVLLVSHNPDYTEKLYTQKIDLMLSGHTHAGQVSLFGLWAPLVPSLYGQKYRHGMIRTPWTTTVVTSGGGTITPPVRFFARPEIVMMTLKRLSTQ